jgi:hypothetical protein
MYTFVNSHVPLTLKNLQNGLNALFSKVYMTKSSHVHRYECSCTPHSEKSVKWLKCVIFKGVHDKIISCTPL